MTTEQYIASLDRVIEKTSNSFAMAVSATHESQVLRIFEQGGNSAGGKIGEYSQKYKKVRQKNNRQVAFVDFKFTNLLQEDFDTTLIKMSPTRWVTGVKNPLNAKKIKKLEERFGKVFDHTQAEKAIFTDILQKELKANFEK